MPKSKQYEDAMGSVFDFIFEQTKQKPSKVKPVSPTGIDGSGEFVDALSTVLEAPLVFVNNSALETFQSATNVGLAKFQVGPRAREEIKFSTADLQNALSDPSKFIDKQFSKIESNRVFSRLGWAGEEMKGIIGGVWARKYGLDFETQQALMSSGKLLNLHTEEAAVEMAKRNLSLIDKHGLSYDELKKLYPKLEESKRRELFDSLTSGSEEKKRKARSEVAFNKDVYAHLESKNLREKANSASTPEEKEKYNEAANFIQNTNAFGKMKTFIEKQTLAKKNILGEIELLRKTSGNQDLIEEKRKELRLINSNLNSARGFRFAEKLGELEGAYGTLKAYTVDGNLFTSIFNREFFDEKKNKLTWLQPSTTKNEICGVNFHLGRKTETKNKIQDLAYEKMNDLYYLSPVTWVESLYTGEMFAFMAHKGREGFSKSIEKLVSQKVAGFQLDKNFFDQLQSQDKKLLDLLNGKLAQADIDKIFQDMPSLENLVDDPKAKAMLEKFLKSDNRLRGLTKAFSTVSRIQQQISDKINEVFTKKIRENIGKVLLRSGVIQKFGGELITKWVAKGGLQLLVKGVVSSIAGALGIVGTPLASAIVSAVTWVAMDLVTALAKPVFKGALNVLKILLFVVLGFIAFIGLFINSFFDTHAGIAPSEVKYCTASGTNPIIDPDNDPNDPSDDIKPSDLLPFLGKDLPTGEECLLGDGAYNCTQGAFGSYSHSNVAAIDLTGVDYFHAPSFCDNGSCEITYSGPINCTAGYAGGMVKMKAEYEGNTYEFKLIHVDTKYTVGDKISGGESVARVMEFSETGNACSSGKHLHMEANFNGSPVNPYDMMTSSLGNGGFACPVSLCP